MFIAGNAVVPWVLIQLLRVEFVPTNAWRRKRLRYITHSIPWREFKKRRLDKSSLFLSHCFSSRRSGRSSGTFYLLFICEDEWMCYNLDSEYARHGVWIHWTMSSTMCNPWTMTKWRSNCNCWNVKAIASFYTRGVCVWVWERMRKFCVKLFIKHLEQH